MAGASPVMGKGVAPPTIAVGFSEPLTATVTTPVPLAGVTLTPLPALILETNNDEGAGSCGIGSFLDQSRTGFASSLLHQIAERH